MSCEAPEDELGVKRSWGLICSTIGVFMCVAFKFTMTLTKNVVRIDHARLDYDLVSIEDYSVRGRISKKFYHDVLEKTKQDKDPKDMTDAEKFFDVPIRRFRSYFKDGVEDFMVKKSAELNKENGDSEVLTKEDCLIADIAFAFDNREMLKLLSKRYDKLKKADFRNAGKIESKMNQLVRDKYDQLVVPNTFFLTFQEGKG